MRQILVNLVGNAIKFTEKGGVSIEAKLVHEGRVLHEARGAGPSLAIVVHDTGIGLDSKDLDRVFEPFYQVDNSLTREYQGTGLGLALSRRLAQVLGGDVLIESSELGKGSRFVFTLKLDMSNSEAPNESSAGMERADAPLKSSPALQRLHALVVEDQKDIREIVARMLESLGVRVSVVENGSEAVEALSRGEYSVVLMDLQMPVMDGFAALRAIRELGRAVPVVALTAHTLDDDVRRIRAAGFNGHLAKPLEREKLIHVLSRVSEPEATVLGPP